MSDLPSSDRASRKKFSNGDEALNELRNILIGPEQIEIQDLQRRLDEAKVQPESVSEVLPEAIRLRGKGDPKLTTSLLPTVEEAIQVSVKKNPTVLVQALFPVMGPAIRKAINATFNAMIQSLNQTLEQSLSLRGLKWRWESIRTGKPFAEIVLLHSLSYRVEQVFLIHRPSGLLLQHVTAPSIQSQDAEMVSGMLTAIQDFIRDSFRVGEEETVHTMRVGELSVWVEESPFAFLAGVIRGTPPEDLRSTFQEALEHIHQEKQEELESFQGDNSVFESVRTQLESCLAVQFKTAKKRLSPAFVIFMILAAIALAWFGYVQIQRTRQWNSYLQRLNSQPGIVVTNSDRGWRIFHIRGLRDPLAKDPVAILKDFKIDSDKVSATWDSYQSLDPQFVLQRAKAVMQPPPQVVLRLRDGILSASGSAPNQWITEARKLVRGIAGVRQFDDRSLNNGDLQALQVLKEKVEQTALLFQRGKSDFLEGQETVLQRLAVDVSQLVSAADQLGMIPLLEIRGHADSEGTEEFNLLLSRQRADRIREFLQSQNVSSLRIEAKGLGTSAPLKTESSEAERQLNRSVSFKLNFSDVKKEEVQ
jgi:OOP family OmpA-OmpF porin